MPKLSVIVPVYNVERYLNRCIESILNQSFIDFELILVDDCSKDNSPQICDEYKKDSRVKVIHNRQNKGLSEARNAGIHVACGTYLSFIDGDDFIVPNTFSIMISELEQNNLDIISGYFMSYITEDNYYCDIRKHTFSNQVCSGVEFICKGLKEGSMSMCVPINFYKRELIIKNNLFFKPGILHEDELWTPQVFINAERVKYIDLFFYMYVMREGSITKVTNKYKNAIDLVNTCYYLEKYFSDNVINKRYLKILNDNILTLFLNAVYIGNLVSDPIIKKSFVFGKPRTIRNKVKAIIFLLNKKVYCKINNRLKRVVKR